MSFRSCLFLMLFLGLLVSPRVEAVELLVSAAVSLKPALEELAKEYATVAKDKLSFNFGSSGALQQQIQNGAPVDIFISAASKQMDALASNSLIINETRKDLVKNELVLIVPKGVHGVSSFDDLKKPTVKRIAIGDQKTVPAGQYAQEVFASIKLSDALAAKLISGNSVRQVLTYVESKDVDAGLVYGSDATDSTKVDVVAKASPSWHSAIVYPIAVMKKSKNPVESKKFVEWLASNAAGKIFKKHGFIVGSDVPK